MKNGWVVQLGLFLLMVTGCTPAGSAQPTPLPVQLSPTAGLPTRAPITVPPAATPARATSNPSPLPTPAAAAEARTVALVDLKISAATTGHYRIVDAATGEQKADLVVHGLTEGTQIISAGDSIFNIDGETHAVRRIHSDGTVESLAFTNPSGGPFSGAFLPSPDGQRIAWSSLQAGPSGEVQVQLKVANSDGSGEKTLIDEKRTTPTRPDPLRWARDGKSLYFSNAPVGIGGYILFAGWQDLYKIDLAAAQVEEILPRGCLCALSLSPDESRLAAINKPEADFLELVLIDLSSMEKRKVRLLTGHTQAGSILWSPDRSELLVTVAVGNPDQESYSIVKVDVDSLELTALISGDPRGPETAAWPRLATVWLNDRNGDAWRMDPGTGALARAAAGERVLPASQ